MTVPVATPRTAAELFAGDEARIEGAEKVSGRLRYTADVQKPNALWAAFTTSPHARARVRRVDPSAAAAIPGVRAVLTASEIGARRIGRQVCDWPILAFEEVRFIGDRVAAIAAETRDAAEEAARAVRVEYEELPAVLDARAALASDAPILHPDWPSYHYPNDPRPERKHPNVVGSAVIAKGDDDLEAIFARAHRVFEHAFETPRQHCGFLEPHATLVWIDDDGTVHVQSVNKMPFSLREQLAHVAGIPLASIVVEPSGIGGDFGGKGFTIDEFPCYYLARATGRPVRYVQTYAEELGAGTTRHQAHLTLKTAVGADGAFLAHVSSVLFDGGAYAAPKAIPWLLPGYGYGAVPYRIPHARIELTSVYTNTVPAAHVRGPGEIQSFFAWEQHVDMIAESLGTDPLAFRARNAVRDGETTLTGEPVRDSTAHAVLETLRRAGADRPLPAGRGRGIALTCGKMGNGATSLRLRLSADGGLELLTGVPEQGSGMHTTLQRVVAAALGVPLARVRVRRGSTAEANVDPGAGASRVTHIMGRAALEAAEHLRTELEARTEMTLRDGRFIDARGRDEPFDSVAARVCADEPLEVTGAFGRRERLMQASFSEGAPAPVHPDFTMAAYAIDVEVDRETGAFEIRDALLVTDVGQIINPLAHRGQVDGGFVFGLGGARFEELPIDEDGRVTRLNLGEYRLPTVRDVPPFRAIHIRAADGDGPFGAKTIGEISNIGVAPALANAIARAVGVRLCEFPITAERIFGRLDGRAAGP